MNYVHSYDKKNCLFQNHEFHGLWAMLGSLKISMRKSLSSKVMNFMVSGSGILVLTLGRDSNDYVRIYNFDRLFIFVYSCFVQLCHCMLFQDELKILHIKSN